jgi:photosystem II stability/assembly factor-like uncharacterized protein
MSTTLVLGTKKGVLVLEKGARSWRARPLQHEGITCSFAFHDARTSTLWAALGHGHWGAKLSRSTDGGSTWAEVPAPRYPEDAAVTMCKKAKPVLQYMYVMSPGRKAEPARLYVGTVPGGLFQSDDSGASFSLVSSLWNDAHRDKWGQGGKDFDEPGLHSVVVDPRDANHVYVGVSSAGVVETRDGGRSWQHRNKGLANSFLPDANAEVGHDPHFLTCCEAEPDVLWQQNHCGVYRSADGGKSWKDVGLKDGVVHFGFACAVDAKNPERAWLVPATSDDKRYAPGGALCVARTDDGGKTWKVLREGLPQENAYDLVYRHGLDVRGDRLAFGSTTGSLYTSEDRGESWTCIGSNFPPINSVRFV